MGIDLKGLMVPLATGIIGAEIQDRRNKRAKEDTSIESAETAAAQQITTGINDAVTDIRNSKTTRNTVFDTQLKNLDLVAETLGSDKQDDLAFLYERNPNLFKGDATQVLANVNAYLGTGLLGKFEGDGVDRKYIPGGDITGDTPAIKSIYEVYGEGATAQDILTQRRNKFNSDVRNGLSNVAGMNNTKLFIDDKIQAGTVREKRLQKPEFTEGRISSEQFVSNINEQIDAIGVNAGLTEMLQGTNWFPALSTAEINASALQAVNGVGPQADLQRETVKFNYYLDSARTIMMQSSNVETLDEAIELMRAKGLVPQGSAFNAMGAMDRAVLDFSSKTIETLAKSGTVTERGIINSYSMEGERLKESNPVAYAAYNQIVAETKETATIAFRNNGYYDLFNNFMLTGEDPNLDIQLVVPVRESDDSPFENKSIIGSIDPQIDSEGNIRIVDKNDIYSTIDYVSVTDLFGTQDSAGNQLTGPSEIFKNMQPEELFNIKQKITDVSGGYEAIKPFLIREAPVEPVPVITNAITLDNYKDFEFKGTARQAGATAYEPEFLEWIDANWNNYTAFIDTLPTDKPKPEDYPEDQRDPGDRKQQYGIDLRFYNSTIVGIKSRYNRLKKIVDKVS